MSTTLNFGVSDYEQRAPFVTSREMVIDVPDYGPLESIDDPGFDTNGTRGLKAAQAECCGLPCVIGIDREQEFGRTELLVIWIPRRGEWVCIIHSNWLESVWGMDDSYSGPFRPEPHHMAKVLEAYCISDSTARFDDIVRMSPADLLNASGLEDSLVVRLHGSGEVEEVSYAFYRLINETITPSDLLQLSPLQFEEFVAELWSRFGYETQLTKRTWDNGVDIVAVRRAEIDTRILIECKRYSPPNHVGIAIVRALYGVKCDEGATKAILATTSSFTSNAIRFWQHNKWELELRDYTGVMDWVRMASHKGKMVSARQAPFGEGC